MKRVTLPGTSSCTAEGAVELELEHADAAVVGDALHLGAQRPVALAGDVLDVLEEGALLDLGDELALAEEVVLDAVRLAGPPRARRRRDRDLEDGHPLDERLDQRSLAGAGRAGDDEHGRHVARGAMLRSTG